MILVTCICCTKMKFTISNTLVKSECLKKNTHKLLGQNSSAAGYSNRCEWLIWPPLLETQDKDTLWTIAIYKSNYCGNDWQIWITLITWTWCLRNLGWGLAWKSYLCLNEYELELQHEHVEMNEDEIELKHKHEDEVFL